MITLTNEHILTGLVTWREFYEELQGRCNGDFSKLNLQNTIHTVKKYVKLFKEAVSVENDGE